MDDQNRKLHASTWKNWKIVVISFKTMEVDIKIWKIHVSRSEIRENTVSITKNSLFCCRIVASSAMFNNDVATTRQWKWKCTQQHFLQCDFITISFVLWIIIHDAFVMKTSEGWTKILCFRSRTLSMKLCRYTRVELTQDYLVQVTGSTTIDVIIIRRGLCISVRSQTDGSIL